MPEPSFPPPRPPAVPPEPAALRARMGEEAQATPAGVRRLLADGEWITDWLWSGWGPELEAAGTGRDDVRREAGRWSRELWLWVMGERQWEEVSALIHGGLLRRGDPLGRVSPSRRAPPPAGSG
ncbi:MAG: hypothetical protein ACYCTI_06515 [Acidimicrobiales bacterium]